TEPARTSSSRPNEQNGFRGSRTFWAERLEGRTIDSTSVRMEREHRCQARNTTAARHWACDKAKEPGKVALHRLLSRTLQLTAAMVLVASVIVVVPAHASADV